MKCPVCGNNTFSECNCEDSICKECFWQYNLVQVSNPDFRGGPNSHSLNEYRKMYWTLKKRNPKFSCKNAIDKDLMVRLDHASDWLAELFEDESQN